MILDDLAEKPNWVAWQEERRHAPSDPQEKPAKVPYAPDGRRARSNDQATWGTRLEAQRRADRLPKPFGRGGVGLVLAPLAPGLHLGGVDLDACMDGNGALYHWAREIVERFNCYTEVSPSGQGLKIFFTYEPGQLTERDYNGRRAVRRANASGVQDAKDHGIEFYLKDRYFTVTGMTFEQFDTINKVDVSVMRWLRNRMEEFRPRDDSDRRGQQNEQHVLADIADAFEQIPNDDSVAWDDWNTRGMAIYAATSGSTEGYEIFRRWSERNRRLYNEAACTERWQAWRRSPPDQLTVRSIFFWAWEANPHWRPPSRNAHSRRRNSAGGFGFPAGEPPLPLKRPIPEGAEFPVAALGSALRGGAEAIEAVTQAPMAMCAAAVLGAASLAVQAFVDVVMPGQRPHPAALFVMVLAESGERKSTVDGLATQTIKERDDEAAADYQALWQVYENDLEAWEASRRVSNRKNQSAEERRQAVRQRIEEAGEKPLPPLEPIMLSSDVTIEGLVKKMERSIGVQGLVTAEAGVIVGGHAMVEEVRLRSCATLSRLWDEGRAERVRASEETVRLRGRRLTISVATQPGNGLTWVRQPDLVDQGLASRLLMVLPESKIGQRMLSEESERRREETAPALIEFERRMRDHLQAIPRVAELSPRPLAFSVAAAQRWRTFVNEVEAGMAPGGPYETIRGFTNKAAEHAARIAAVLAAFEDPDVPEISAEALDRGVEIARYFLSEAQRIAAAASTEDRLDRARQAWEFVREFPSRDDDPRDLVHLSEVYRLGPPSVRTAEVAAAVMGDLADHGYVVRLAHPAEVDGRNRKNVWRIRPEALAEDPYPRERRT